MKRVYEPFVFVRRWFITKNKPFAKKEPFRKGPRWHFLTGLRGLEIHITKLASSWSNNLNSPSAARPPESVQPCARVRRPEVCRCTRRCTCPGVANERVGNLAVAEANSKKAIRMLFYSKRSCALPTLKNTLRLQNNGKLVRWFLWQEQRWAHGWPPAPRDDGSVP